MSKLEQFPELKSLFDKLEEVGFENNDNLIFSVFNEDRDYCSFTRGGDWGEINSLFDEIELEFDYELVEGEYGGEGEGEYCYGIIKLKDKFYKAEWSYYSYDGVDYDGIEDTITEVEPKEVVVTKYYPVK